MRTQVSATSFRRIVLAVGLALVLGACEQAAADPETVLDTATTTSVSPPSTTSTTTVPPIVNPALVSVLDLSGLALADAQELLAGLRLGVVALPEDVGSAIVIAQDPAPGLEAEEGSVVVVDVHAVPTCNPPDPIAPSPGEVIITVLFECGNDDDTPTPRVGVARIVPEQGGEAIDRIEWTLRSLLAGPTDDERIAGFVSGFDAATADALNGLALINGRLAVDFNNAIVINNMSTSTGSIQFHAELHRNVFQHPEVASVEFHLNRECEAWSGLFESDGCRVTTRADWYQELSE